MHTNITTSVKINANITQFPLFCTNTIITVVMQIVTLKIAEASRNKSSKKYNEGVKILQNCKPANYRRPSWANFFWYLLTLYTNITYCKICKIISLYKTRKILICKLFAVQIRRIFQPCTKMLQLSLVRTFSV